LVLGLGLVRLTAGIALEELSGRILPIETLFSFATEFLVILEMFGL
jgi:hypothetical protein